MNPLDPALKRNRYIRIVAVSAAIAEEIGPTCSSCFAGTLRNGNKGIGCCGGCAGSKGYIGVFGDGDTFSLEHGLLTTKQFADVAAYFGFDAHGQASSKGDYHHGKGFLGPTGCNLPREIRSTTCLSFVCGHVYDEHPIVDAFEQWHSEMGGSRWD